MAIPMRPLSCAEAREEAARRIFEPLEPHTAATLDAHLAICHDCREQVQDMEHAARLLRSSVLVHDPPDDLEDRLIRGVRTEPVARRRSLRRVVTATMAVVLLIGGLGLVVTSPRAARADSVALAPAERAGRAGGTATILRDSGAYRVRLVARTLPTLVDGAAYGVWIDTGDDGWRQLGQFRQSAVDNVYDAGAARPGIVKVTIERTGMSADAPGLEVMTGRFGT